MPPKIPLPGAPEYAPYEIPEAVEAPPAPPAQTVQNLPGDTSQAGPKYGFGKGASGVLGSIAFFLNNGLRGYAAGKANQQAKMAMNIKRTTDGLNMAYQMAAKKYYELYKAQIEAGKKPTDPDFATPELQQAAAAKDASWAAMMKFMAQNVGQPTEKKGKGKKGKEDEQGPFGGLMSQDPQERAQAWLALATKMGPDVDIQTRQLSSKAGMAGIQYETQRVENLAQHEDIQKQLNEAELVDTSKFTEDQKKSHQERIAQLKEALATSTPAAPGKASASGDKFFAPRYGPNVTGADIRKLYGDTAPGPNGDFTPADGDLYKEVIYGERAGQPLVRYEPATAAGQLKITGGRHGEPVQKVFNPYTKNWAEGDAIGALPQKVQWIKVDGRDTYGNPVQMVVPFMPQYKDFYVQPPAGVKFDQPVNVGSEGVRQSGTRLYDSSEIIPQPISSGATDQPNAPQSGSTPDAVRLASMGYPVPQGKMPEGLVAPPTLDLNNRPVLHNPDGSVSTELSFSREQDGREVLVPQIVNGKKLTEDEAWKHYQESGEHLGKFDTAQHANAYAQMIHGRPQQKPSAGTPKAEPAGARAAPQPLAPEQHTAAEQAATAAGLPAGSQVFQKFNKDLRSTALAIGAQELTINGQPGSTTDVGLRRSLENVLKDPEDVKNLGLAFQALDNYTKQSSAAGNSDNFGWIGFAEADWNRIPAVREAISRLHDPGRQYLPNFFRAWTNASLIRSLAGQSGRPTMAMQAMLANEIPMPGINVHSEKDAERYISALQDDVNLAKSRLPKDMSEQIDKDYPQPAKKAAPSATSPATKPKPGGPKKSQEEIMRDLSGQFGIEQPGAHQ